MKTYDESNDRLTADDSNGNLADTGIQAMFPENPFAEVAYEWNHALRIAVEKMWGDQPSPRRKFN